VDKIKDNNFIEDLIKNKKKKADENLKFLILSPCLSLLLNYGNMLISDQWESRQAAACGLTSLLDIFSKQLDPKKMP
jgi:hypothetical protein